MAFKIRAGRVAVSRRALLKTAAGFGALAASPLALQVAHAMSVEGLGEDDAATLLRMSKDIYPHEKLLDDKPYLAVIKSVIDGSKKTDPSIAVIVDGVQNLNERAKSLHGVPYAQIRSEGARTGILRIIQDTPFFSAFHNGLKFGLYNDPELWPLFGYEGSSWQKGGYINRGFSDATWIPPGPTDEERIAAVATEED